MSVVLTRSRVSNALKCYATYALNRLGSALFRTPYTVHHTPLFISVEPANVCQLRCPACPVGLRDNVISKSRDLDRFMSLDVWHRTLGEVAKSAWVIQFYFQGEPLLNKDLPLMIREAHEAGLYTIVSTNAQALTPELAQALVASGLDRIIISMDGLTQESYSAYRIGGDLEKTKAALRWLQKSKSRDLVISRSPIIELQVLRLKSNEHEWSDFKRLYKSLGADRLTFKTAQLYDYSDGHPLMPSNPRYNRYIKGSDGRYHRRPLPKGCFRVWSGAVITTTGDLLPCCYDKAHAYAYGNIMNAHISELFNNDKATAFRRLAFRQTPEICKECWK